MTTVNVTTTKNTVTVTENGTSTVVETPVTTVVTASFLEAISKPWLTPSA